MITKLIQCSLLSATVLGSSLALGGNESASEDELSVVLVSRSASATCGKEKDVKRELSVCHDAKGCYKRNLNRNQGVSFSLPRHGSFTLAASGEYRQVRDAFRDLSEVPERIVQIVETTNQCQLTFTYRVTY